MRKIISKIWILFKNISEISLLVHKENIPAIKLYERCGFKTAGLRPNYYRDGGDALIQWQSLKRTS